uniref:Uncharacterized protein n=1 Tax=Romanomermis culicivorax TaxID=13658 RepID=A0A915L9C4_ROMCU
MSNAHAEIECLFEIYLQENDKLALRSSFFDEIQNFRYAFDMFRDFQKDSKTVTYSTRLTNTQLRSPDIQIHSPGNGRRSSADAEAHFADTRFESLN